MRDIVIVYFTTNRMINSKVNSYDCLSASEILFGSHMKKGQRIFTFSVLFLNSKLQTPFADPAELAHYLREHKREDRGKNYTNR